MMPFLMSTFHLHRFPSGRRCILAIAMAVWAVATVSANAAEPAEPQNHSPQNVAHRAADTLQLADGDKIVIIGNTLAERMQHDGYFETLLHGRFPAKQLVVRNLGWSADEVDLRPRSANFEDHGHNLEDHKPQVVLAMFGLSESFAGPAGLDAFRQRFEKFIAQTKQQIGDQGQLVIFSPIPHENLKRRMLPDGSATNANLQLYSAVMR